MTRRSLLAAVAALGFAAFPGPAALAQGSTAQQFAQMGRNIYTVFCTNGRIGVEQRTPQQMASIWGSSTCQMGPSFDFMTDARNFADRNFGGPDRPCSCR